MSADATPDLWVPETDPDTRWRHALVVGLNRAVGEDSSVQADYRIYHDTWASRATRSARARSRT